MWHKQKYRIFVRKGILFRQGTVTNRYIQSESREMKVNSTISNHLTQNRDAHTRTVVLAPYFRTLCTNYMEYGVRRPSYLGSTDFSTGSGHFSSTTYEEYGTPRVRIKVPGTEYVEYRFKFKHGLQLWDTCS